MADHVFSALCSRCLVDSDSNNLTLVEVTERLTLNKRPEPPQDRGIVALTVNLVLVTVWIRSDINVPESPEVRAILKGPNGKTATARGLTLQLREYVRFRVRIQIPTLPFAGFGFYKFVVQKKTKSGRWSGVATVPLELALQAETTKH